jgi:hypothetical protein
MPGSGVYPQELRARAVRMVAEVRPNYESDWAAISSPGRDDTDGSHSRLRSRSTSSTRHENAFGGTPKTVAVRDARRRSDAPTRCSREHPLIGTKARLAATR